MNWLRAGAADVLSKPMKSDQLGSVIAKISARDKTLPRRKKIIQVLTLDKKKNKMPALVRELAGECARELRSGNVKFTDEAIGLMAEYALEHGLQKLENGMARAVILCPSSESNFSFFEIASMKPH